MLKFIPEKIEGDFKLNRNIKLGYEKWLLKMIQKQKLQMKNLMK